MVSDFIFFTNKHHLEEFVEMMNTKKDWRKASRHKRCQPQLRLGTYSCDLSSMMTMRGGREERKREQIMGR